MQIPLQAYVAPLTDYQFRLLAVLCHLKAPGSPLKATTAELGRLTGNVSTKTVRRALIALEEAGFITRTRLMLGKGRLGCYQVDITSPADNSKWASNVRTAGDYVANSSKSLVPNSQDSYKLKDSESKKIQMKEVRIPMRKWEDDGDSLAGFGLVEPKDAPQPKVRKSDPRTRGKRPEHEWTPMDVAAEFSYRVGKKYPLLPGTVNVKQLSGALAKFRKQYDTTPLIELELLRLFMADEDNFRQIGDEAPFLYKKFLSSFGKKMNQARENLGLNKVTAKIETEPKAKTLVASDGRVFQNSLSGRTQLERYEKKLRANNV